MLGSITYVADEYDDLIKKIYAASIQIQTNLQNFKRLNHELQKIKTRQNETVIQIEKLEQYGRTKNLELHGSPTEPNDSTNETVKHVASLLKVQLYGSHISISQPDY